mmetsp:Transcript_6487/g.15681  ORF Transcript_6487/g.15681 Transcript_6487/m.15681 type:complete len:332 (-) Transcript_6487:429-1424(-)
MLLMHEVIEIVHLLLEVSRANIQLPDQSRHVPHNNRECRGAEGHHDDGEDQFGCRLLRDVPVSDCCESREGDVERHSVLDKGRGFTHVLSRIIETLEPSRLQFAVHLLHIPNGRIVCSELPCHLVKYLFGALDADRAQFSHAERRLDGPVGGHVLLPADYVVEQTRDQVSEEEDSAERLRQPEVSRVDRKRIPGFGDEFVPSSQPDQPQQLHQTHHAEDAVEFEGLQSSDVAPRVIHRRHDRLQGKGASEIEPEPPAEVVTRDQLRRRYQHHPSVAVRVGVWKCCPEVEQHVRPEAHVHKPSEECGEKLLVDATPCLVEGQLVRHLDHRVE